MDSIKIINAGSPSHEAALRNFAEFIEADSIEYIDHGKKETYIIKKEGRIFEANTGSATYDGSWVNFSEVKD